MEVTSRRGAIAPWFDMGAIQTLLRRDRRRVSRLAVCRRLMCHDRSRRPDPRPADPSYAGRGPACWSGCAGPGRAGVDGGADAMDGACRGRRGLKRFPLVLPLIVWGYHRDHARWLRACRTWERPDCRCSIRPRCWAGIRTRAICGGWRQGVAIPRPSGSSAHRRGRRRLRGHRPAELVVKPPVSGGAWKTLRLSRGEAFDGRRAGRAGDDPALSADASRPRARPRCCSSAAG